MLSVGQLQEGVVLDHIPAGKAMDIYKRLKLDRLDCQVAMIMHAHSNKMGQKDIIKVEAPLEKLDLDALGFIDHTITVNIIRDGSIVEKQKLKLPLQEAEMHFDHRAGSGPGFLPRRRGTRDLPLPLL